jgi:hypothetical protein
MLTRNINQQIFEGIDKLLSLVGPEHPEYLPLLTLQGRFAKVVQDENRFGATETVRSDFARVLEELNRVSQATQNQSFNAVSGIALPHENLKDRQRARFLSGGILCIEVVNFLFLDLATQAQAIHFLEQETKSFLNLIESHFWLDFNGGNLLLFLERSHDETQQATLARLLIFGLHSKLKTANLAFKLGITLHWEDNATWHYLGEQAFLTGHALNEAYLLMSFSDGEHFFISTIVYDSIGTRFFGKGRNVNQLLVGVFSELSNDYKSNWPSLMELNRDFTFQCQDFMFHDHHKRQYKIFNFFVEGHGNIYGNKMLPSPLVAIDNRDDRILSPNQAFVQRLVEADDITIIGLTNEGTAEFLREALEIRKSREAGFWQRLRVVFPSEAILGKFIEKNRTEKERRALWETGKRKVFKFLLNQGEEAVFHSECLEYDGILPFVGNWFVGENNQSVRIAPILPGCDLRDTYYMEFFKGMQAYDQVTDAFSAICNRGSAIAEWDIYGQVNNNYEFRYTGIVNRKNLASQAGPGICFPVVLIMLYAETNGTNKSFLQERTIYNGSDDIGTYSNISGRLTDIDVCLAKGLPSVDFYNTFNPQVEPDIQVIEFNRKTGLSSGVELPSETWQKAAIREVYEELGLHITPERLQYHIAYHLSRPDGTGLYFQIYSLKLRRDINLDELKTIQISRPHANLEPFTFNKLCKYHREHKFNRLLQMKFEEVFEPIFLDKLMIDKGEPS